MTWTEEDIREVLRGIATNMSKELTSMGETWGDYEELSSDVIIDGDGDWVGKLTVRVNISYNDFMRVDVEYDIAWYSSHIQEANLSFRMLVNGQVQRMNENSDVFSTAHYWLYNPEDFYQLGQVRDFTMPPLEL